MPLNGNMWPPQHHNLFAVLELHFKIRLPPLQLGYQIVVTLLESGVQIMFAGRSTLEALKLAVKLEDTLLDLVLRLMFCLMAASIWSGTSWTKRSSRKCTRSLMLVVRVGFLRRP